MKRVGLAAILLALAISASVSQSSARTAAQTGNDLLQFLPDGSAVIVVDMQRVTGSSLWAAISSQDKIKSGLEKAQAEISELGVRLSDVQAVALVFAREGSKDPTVAVTGGFEQSDLLARMRANAKIKLASEKYKNYEIFKATSVNENKSASHNDGSFAFFDSRTAVVGSADSVRASIDTKLGSRPGISQNAKLAEALAQNTAGAIRFALEFTPAMASGLQSSQAPLPDFASVKLIFGSIDVASGLDLIATLRNDSAEHAKNMAERLNGLLEMARGFLSASNDPKMTPFVGALKTVSISGSDIDVKITGSVPLEVITQLLK
jgi:hypothetical protein